MFRRVLVADRGEIAVRILRTVRELGILGVGVCSREERASAHVALAHRVVTLPGPDGEAYRDPEAILRAALEHEVDALHPGYGPLAESPSFARRVAGAGVVFVGPGPDLLELFSDKLRARALASSLGLPVLPGGPVDREPHELAREVGYPLVVKPVAGGGGRGIVTVWGPDGLDGALAEARGRAQALFGDPRVYLEAMVPPGGRHVEVQLLGDSYGNLIHLYERDCSAQRRRQKLVEEAPAPGLDPRVAARLREMALELGRAVGYQGLGTVEFMLHPDLGPFFIEVNPRLQVEHPVTEELLGLDLVREQLRVAAGEPLGFGQEDLVPRGWAMECRVYAEDPGAGFAPVPGRVLAIRPPTGPGLRFDSGVQAGALVSEHHDPILGKLVVLGSDRAQAVARLAQALQDLVILGPGHGVEFLVDLVTSRAFMAGALHTGMVEDLALGWTPSRRWDLLAGVAAVLHAPLTGGLAGDLLTGGPSPASVWRLRSGGSVLELSMRPEDPDVFVILATTLGDVGERTPMGGPGDGSSFPPGGSISRGGPHEELRVRVLGRWRGRVLLEVEGEVLELLVEPRSDGSGQGWQVWCRGRVREVYSIPVGSGRGGAEGQEGGGAHLPPTPGVVVSLLAKPGDRVEEGQGILVILAMKLQMTLRAPRSGVLSRLLVQEGDRVAKGQVCFEIT